MLMTHSPENSHTENKFYDVLVIGAGIHGAGVAQAAAAAGYSVLVLEQGAVASGTSSRSSKLIHGGLRYLEHGQFSLVRECLRERALLLKLAPGLVQLRPFFIPVYTDSSRNRWLIRAGLTLYALLGGVGRDTRFRSLPQREWQTLDGLKTDGLRTVFQYWDAQTDDRQLTRAVMASAQTLGAELQHHTAFCSAERVADSQIGECWKIHYRRKNVTVAEDTGHEHTCTARVMVNAAGPWVNKVLKNFSAAFVPLPINLVQGTHLVLEGEVSRGIYYLESPQDQRPVFVMPWQVDNNTGTGNAILLGTTETRFQGDPATVRSQSEEQNYLLETYRHYFCEDVKLLNTFAGVRVLPGSAEDTSYATRARETVLHPDQADTPHLITVYGGKLTTYRSTSQKVLEMLANSLPKCNPVADTRSLPLVNKSEIP